jgi:hypothetical protein
MRPALGRIFHAGRVLLLTLLIVLVQSSRPYERSGISKDRRGLLDAGNPDMAPRTMGLELLREQQPNALLRGDMYRPS